MMADLARIKRNVAKMAAQNAPEADIDGYIASEGVTVDDVRNFRMGGVNQPPGVPTYVPPGVEGYDPQTGEVSRQYGKVGSAAMGAADAATLGWGDELASYLGSAISGIPRGKVLSEMRGDANAAQEQNPGSYLAGQIGGGLAQGVATGGAGFGTSAAKAGAGLGKVALGSAVDGMALGGAYGAGSADEGSRLSGAGLGAGAGFLLGGGMPVAVAGLSAAASPFLAPLMARLKPQDYANKALQSGVRKSGMTADDIANMLTRANADDQGMFTVADAMGHQGGRMLSTAVRNPNEARQQIVDALTGRQMGQGERLSNFLAEGFGAPDTAAQRAASLGAQRTATANANYNSARAGAGAVDTSGAIQAADDFLTPGATGLMNPGTNIADDSIEAAVRRARSYLTDGRSNLSDFNAALRSKQELDAMIEGARPAVQRQLIPIRNALDDALESASPNYAQARDVFRQQSRAIDAIDAGKAAASGRSRAPDNIASFQRMAPDEQSAFRAGYVDPLIARNESMAVSPTTNKARPLMTTKSGQEFPEFAAPGQAGRLGNRIAREQRMFETSNAALGGSKTADNLADAAEMAKFDPSIMAKLFSGRPVAAVMEAVTKLINEGKGMPPGVLERVGQALMTTDPNAARAVLSAAQQTVQRNAVREAIAAQMLRGAALPAIEGR
ncbi:MAG: hypothetical protein ACTHKQ_05715 [Mesorhizobium sp.]